MVRLTLRIEFDDDRAIGPGKARLLELIQQHCSIAAAGRAMGMSYRRAWLLVDDLNRCFDEPVDIGGFVLKSAIVSRPNFGHYTGTAVEVRAITDRLFGALRAHILTVEIGQRYPLSEAAEAHRALEARRTTGSTILLP